MAVQILPTPNNLSYGLGQGVGAGIASGTEFGLNTLLSRRERQRSQEQSRKGLEAFFSPEQAAQISQLPEPLQLQALKNAQMQQRFQQQQEQLLHKEQFKQQQEIEKQRLHQEEEQRKEILATRKLHKSALDRIASEGTEAEKNEEMINQLDKIIKSGKFQGAGSLRHWADKIGFGSYVANEETQLAQKLMQRLAFSYQSGKNTGNLTNAKLAAYERANLSLLNEPKGAKLILDSMRLDVDKSKAVDKARRKIIKQYEGKPLPDDILELIQDEARKNFQNIDRKEKAIAQKYDHYIDKYISKDPEVNQPDDQNRPEGWGEFGTRTALRGAARMGESIAGLPGDILSGIGGLANWASGDRIPNYKQIQEKLPISIPTSQNIREGLTQKATGQYLEPQGKGEALYDDFVGDLATLWAPGKIAGKGITGISKLASYFAGPGGLGKQAARSAAANLASFGAKEIGGASEGLAGGIKAGILIASGLPGAKKVLEEKKTELYNKADAILAKDNPMFKSKELGSKLNELTNWVDKEIGASIESKKEVLDMIKAIDKRISNQGISIKDALSVKRGIDKKIYSGKLDAEIIPKAIDLKNTFNDIVQNYGSKNKEFGIVLNEADSIYKGIKAENKIAKFVKDTVNTDKYVNNKIIKSLLFMSNPLLGLKAAAGYTALNKISQGADFLKLIGTNRPAQKYLLQAWAKALSQDKAGLASAVKNLDKSLSHR